jgi:TRAP-type mannitol/chloroaromatic compound transport system permease small subunit
MLIAIEKWMDRVIDWVGYMTGVLLIIMILNVAFDVMMRYVFHNSSIGMQEVEWHLFAVIILYGTGYALRHNAHVRVDFVYDRLAERKKAWINIIGTILFILPLTALLIDGSYNFVMDAYTTNEISEDPGGLPYRGIIKAQIPAAFVFLVFAAINYILHHINVLRGLEPIAVLEEGAA